MPVARSYRRSRRKVRKHKKAALRLIALGLVLVGLVLFIDHQIRPQITALEQYQAKIYAVKTMNEAVTEQVESYGYTYDNLSEISRDADGQVTSIDTNIKNINLIHTGITNRVNDALSQLDMTSIWIPLGNLTNSPLLSGRGPRIEIKLMPRGYVRTQIVSSFSDAGINQTLHRLLIKVSAEIAAILPGYYTTVQVDTEYVLAETIVVGRVPENYTKVLTDSEQMLRDINDYGTGADSTAGAGSAEK